jgi:2-phosphosulfolactate phosphatase
VTLVATGTDADEDVACADYLDARLTGGAPDAAPYLARVRAARGAQKFLQGDHPAFPRADLELCAQLDIFDFAMTVTRQDGLSRLVRSGAGVS